MKEDLKRIQSYASFNYHMLKIAMDIRGFTQVKLAKAVGSRQPVLSRILNGREEPDDELVFAFVKVLGFPVTFFYQAGKIYPVQDC